MLNSIFESSTEMTFGSVGLLIAVSLICGLCIAYTHMKTTRYSKNFIGTLTILPTLIAITIFLVNGNLGTSIAVLGAFSLIRFRSIPGNSKEIASVFFAMTIGLALGMGYLLFAFFITIILCLCTWLLAVSTFGENKNRYKILKILIPEQLDYQTVFDDIFETYTKHNRILQVKTTNMGSLFELTYEIDMKNEKLEKQFLDELRVRNGNLKITFSHPLTEGEL